MSRRSRHPGVRLYTRQRGDGPTHYARVEADGVPLHHVNLTALGYTGSTDADKRERVLWAIERSRQLHGHRPGVVRLTVSEACAAYHGDLLQAAAPPNTISAYRVTTRRLQSFLGPETPLDCVRPQDLWGLRRDLLAFPSRDGGPPRPHAGNSRLGLAARVLEVWRQQGLVPLLASDHIRDALRRLRTARDRPRWLTRAEIRALLDAAGAHPLPRIVLLTGMRIREALRLTWAEVDLGSLAIRLPARTKTKRGRDIELSICPSVATLLRELPRTRDLVLPGGVAYETQRLRLLPRLREAVPGVRWKDLRSTCASYLHSAAGIPLSPYARAAQLGHSLEVALRRYCDVVRDIPPRARTLEQAMGLAPVPVRLRSRPLGGTTPRST